MVVASEVEMEVASIGRQPIEQLAVILLVVKVSTFTKQPPTNETDLKKIKTP